MDMYSRSYRCPNCSKLWDHSGNFLRHRKVCQKGTKRIYLNGIFEIKPNIFDRLEEDGVEIAKEDRIFPYRATYDVECFLKKAVDVNDTEKTIHLNEHNLISVSISSNVPSYSKPKHFVLKAIGDEKELVQKMVQYLNEISDKSSCLLREKFAPILTKIKSERLREDFEGYIGQLPVISFNGSKYDLNVMRKYLIPIIVNQHSFRFMIKKGSAYLTIVTDDLKFLDVTHYISPGFSYDKFIKAYGIDQKKSFFPYEYLDSLEKLKENTFPGYTAFYSTLKEHNTLEPQENDHLTAEEEQVVGRKPTKSKPLMSSEVKIVALHRYETLKNMFESQNWTIADYLEFYNNLDVEPFLRALENLCRYYCDRGVDIFKEAVSGKIIIIVIIIIIFSITISCMIMLIGG